MKIYAKMHKIRLIIILFLTISVKMSAIPMNALSDSLTIYANQKAIVGKVTVKHIRTSGNTAKIQTCPALSFLSLSPEELRDLRQKVSMLVFGTPNGTVNIYSDGYELGELVTMRYKAVSRAHVPTAVQPLTRNTDRGYQCPDGLDGRHIALWGSHGWYYNNKFDRWLWQRAKLWTTVEDLFTSSYTMPYLVPMLENAGAVVIQPRERDTQTEMVIIDSTAMREQEGVTIAETRVPKEGNYAVYIWYNADRQASSRTRMEVEHRDRTTTYEINRQIGAGTWVYVGTHNFSPDETARIRVHAGKEKLTAIRLGGGVDEKAQVPRYAVGASQYLPFAGIPDSIIDYTKGENTYTNDFACRGLWVNYLLGGSQLAPHDRGLGIPIDMSLALHSNAGICGGDSTFGSMIIYCHKDDKGCRSLPLGDSRLHSRYLGDYVQTQIVEDMRALHAPAWTRSWLRNAGYAEVRQPLAPAIIVEMLSHQNMNDMRLALDPKVKFTISRAIYKGILRYLATSRGESYVVQPLPVQAVSTTLRPTEINKAKQDSIIIRWQPTADPLEPTATAQYYIVYTRQARIMNGQMVSGDWDNGTRVSSTHLGIRADRGIRYDFRVVAGNKGGVSMPSETHCAYIAPKSKGTVKIINNFTRVAAPAFYADSLYAGIVPQHYAIADGVDVAYIGDQYDDLRSSKWESDDNCGWGASYCDQQFVLTAGNTHDYPLLHGRVLTEMGYSYSSAAVAAIRDTSDLRGYDIVDVICGKQKTEVRSQKSEFRIQNSEDRSQILGDTIYELFPTPLRAAIVAHTQKGGSVLLTGMYIGSEAQTVRDAEFARQVLRFTYRGDHASRRGTVLMGRSMPVQMIRLATEPNPQIICCENLQGITPARGSEAIATYTDSGMTAGVAYEGEYKLIALPFMIESANDFAALYRNCIQKLTIDN